MNGEIPIIFDELHRRCKGDSRARLQRSRSVRVIGEDARMTAEAGPYAGLDRFEARKRVVADLEKLGLLDKIDPHALPIGKCDRCGTVVEPWCGTAESADMASAASGFAFTNHCVDAPTLVGASHSRLAF